MNPFKGLNGILTQFTKTQKELEAFMKRNAEKIKKEKLALEIKEREQAKAEVIKGRIEEFLSVPNAE